MTPELAITSELVPPLPAYSSLMMSAKRCGLASLLLNINGALPPRFTKLVSFVVNGEFYFTNLLLGFLRRLVVPCKPMFRLPASNELTDTDLYLNKIK